MIRHPERLQVWTAEERRLAELERHSCNAAAMAALLILVASPNQITKEGRSRRGYVANGKL